MLRQDAALGHAAVLIVLAAPAWAGPASSPGAPGARAPIVRANMMRAAVGLGSVSSLPRNVLAQRGIEEAQLEVHAASVLLDRCRQPGFREALSEAVSPEAASGLEALAKNALAELSPKAAARIVKTVESISPTPRSLEHLAYLKAELSEAAAAGGFEALERFFTDKLAAGPAEEHAVAGKPSDIPVGLAPHEASADHGAERAVPAPAALEDEKKPLGLSEMVAMGLNSIIGSGIFRAPAALILSLGSLSPWIFAIMGPLLFIPGYTFRLAARRNQQTGGPYAYAKQAYSSEVAFGVGSITWFAQTVGWAAVVSFLTGFILQQWPGFIAAGYGGPVVVGVIASMGILNMFTVKESGTNVKFWLAVKSLPLIAFVGAGLWHMLGHGLGGLQTMDVGALASVSGHSLAGAIALTFFSFEGFQTVPATAGEVRNAKRNIPLAMMIALVASTLLYVAVQLVAVGVLPAVTPEIKGAPLAAAAAIMVGPIGAAFMTVAAIISIIGYSSGAALYTPRYLQALSQDGHVPAIFSKLWPGTTAPYMSVAFTTAMAALLALYAPLNLLVFVTTAAVSAQIAITALSVLRMEAREGYPGGWKARWFPRATLGLIALMNGFLLYNGEWQHFAAAGVFLAAAYAYRALRNR